RNGTKAFEGALEFIVAENQSVAARQQNVPDFGVLFEVAKRLLEISVQFLFSDTADETAARAITAVTGATISDEKQNAVGITMNQARHRHVRIFSARVDHVVGRGPRFLDPRNDLAPDWVVGIIARNQVDELGRDGERELVAGEQHSAPFFN